MNDINPEMPPNDYIPSEKVWLTLQNLIRRKKRVIIVRNTSIISLLIFVSFASLYSLFINKIEINKYSEYTNYIPHLKVIDTITRANQSYVINEPDTYKIPNNKDIKIVHNKMLTKKRQCFLDTLDFIFKPDTQSIIAINDLLLSTPFTSTDFNRDNYYSFLKSLNDKNLLDANIKLLHRFGNKNHTLLYKNTYLYLHNNIDQIQINQNTAPNIFWDLNNDYYASSPISYSESQSKSYNTNLVPKEDNAYKSVHNNDSILNDSINRGNISQYIIYFKSSSNKELFSIERKSYYPEFKIYNKSLVYLSKSDILPKYKIQIDSIRIK